MSLSRPSLPALLLACGLPVAVLAQADDPLPTAVQRQTDGFAQAYGRADAADMYEAGRKLLETSGPDQTVAIGRRLAAAGVNVFLADAVVDARRRLRQDGNLKGVAPPGSVETPLVAEALLKEAAEGRGLLRQGVRLNMPQEAIDAQLQALSGRREVAGDLLRIEDDLATVLANARRPKHDLSGVAGVPDAKELAARRTGVELLAERVVERMVQSALVQIPPMLETLGKADAAYADRLAAVRRLDDDVALLDQVQKDYGRRRHPAPDTPTGREVKRALADTKKAYQRVAPRFRAQVHHLEQAVFWWKRGRYGVGEALGGLAKLPQPRARNQALAWQAGSGVADRADLQPLPRDPGRPVRRLSAVHRRHQPRSTGGARPPLAQVRPQRRRRETAGLDVDAV